MSKETFYFSHDYNASTDVKILFLRQQLGIEGYGIFWYVVEQLAASGGKMPLKIIPVLSMQMQVTETKVNAVIQNFELFTIAEDCFFSKRLNEHLQKRRELKEINSNKGKKSAEKRLLNSIENKQIATTVQPQLSNGSTTVQQRKGKERKGNTSNILLEDIKLKQNGFFLNELDKAFFLSEIDIGKTIQFVKIHSSVELSHIEVQKYFEAFKINNLDKKEWYKSLADLISHFRNSLKLQIINSKKNNSNGTENKQQAIEQF
jgi:hypothetical protein